MNTTDNTNNVLPALKLLATSPTLKPEDSAVLQLFIDLAQRNLGGGMTMLDMLQTSQDEGTVNTHFRHPLADVLTEEFVGRVFIDDRCTCDFEFEAEFDDGYHVWFRDVEFMWEPARYVKDRNQREEQQRRELLEELDRRATLRAEAAE